MKTRSLRPERRAPSATRGKSEKDEADKISGVFDPWSDSLLLLVHWKVSYVGSEGKFFDRFAAVKTRSLRAPSEQGPAGRASLPLGNILFADDALLAKWLVEYMLPQYVEEALQQLGDSESYGAELPEGQQREQAKLKQLQAVLKGDLLP